LTPRLGIRGRCRALTGRSGALVLAIAAIIDGCAKERPFAAEVLPAQPAEQSPSGEVASRRGDAAPPSLTIRCTEGGCPTGFVCATTGDCVECNTNEQCGNTSSPVCDATTHVCIACSTDADCPDPRPFCSRNPTNSRANACIQCRSDEDCGGDSPACDLSTNTCTARCQASTQCSGQTPICNSSTRVCVQCLMDSDCPPESSRCDGLTFRCVTCLDDLTCPTGQVCDVPRRNCVQCLDSSQCSSETSPHCLTETGVTGALNTCVGCIGNGDCANKPGIGSQCRTSDGRCVGCLDDSDCADTPAASTCLDSGAGGPCSADQDC